MPYINRTRAPIYLSYAIFIGYQSPRLIAPGRLSYRRNFHSERASAMNTSWINRELC